MARRKLLEYGDSKEGWMTKGIAVGAGGK